MVNNNKGRGVITVSPWFSVYVDSFMIAPINVSVQYSSNEVRVHKVSTVLRKQLSVWSSLEIVAL